jgi:hypothetical protein
LFRTLSHIVVTLNILCHLAYVLCSKMILRSSCALPGCHGSLFLCLPSLVVRNYVVFYILLANMSVCCKAKNPIYLGIRFRISLLHLTDHFKLSQLEGLNAIREILPI